MSQRAVESALGRLVTDAEFRARFFAEPAVLCREHDLPLTPQEARALLQLDLDALHTLAIRLDPKIVRAVSVSPPVSQPNRPRSLFPRKLARSSGSNRI
jgi:hypothetical protein